MLLGYFLVVAASWISGVAAQTTDASCLPFYQWMFNSHKKSPCEVASSLTSVCISSYNVAALPENTHYLGPPTLDSSNSCQCNTVVYSLMSACGACQGRTYDSWSTWSANCRTVSIGSYPEPIPPNTYIPGWAYLDIKNTGIFDAPSAKQNANATESTAIPSPKSTSSRSSPTRSTSAVAVSTSSPPVETGISPSGAASQTSSFSEAHANAVIGGVVGGTFGLSLILGFAYWFISRRRNEKASDASIPSSESRSPVGEPEGMRQYLANTLPFQPAPSSTNTSSLASPTSAVFTSSSKSGSIRSQAMGPANV